MSPFGLKFSQMILHTETSNLMYNLSFLFEVLHKPTLLPSTFNPNVLHLWTQWHCLELIVNICRILIVNYTGELPTLSLLLIFKDIIGYLEDI